VADEVAWRLASRFTEREQDRQQERQLVADLRPTISPAYQRPPVHTVESITSAAGQQLLESLQPDVCIIMLNVMLPKRIFNIPPLGMLIFHPGLVPEYRGVHCGLWAVANDDVSRIGWSLLRIDEGVDTGPVLAQGVAKSIDPRNENYSIMQHKAQFDGVPDVVTAMQRLAAGENPQMVLSGRSSGHYTHPGFSDFLRYRRVLRRYRTQPVTVANQA
jgi:methionyl-tRNA formyltransferase